MTLPLRIQPVIVTVDRTRYKATLWKMGTTRYQRKAKYPIAVGRIGDATPAGMYHVISKTRTPDWRVPEHPDYPPESWGTIVPFTAPNNPFDGGFIDLGDGYGLHGTKFDPKLGTRASHGCIRFAVPDLLELYYQVPDGTPVFVY